MGHCCLHQGWEVEVRESNNCSELSRIGPTCIIDGLKATCTANAEAQPVGVEAITITKAAVSYTDL